MNTIKIDVSDAGDNIVIPGVANKKIRVLSYLVTSMGQGYFVWKSGSTPISGNVYLSAFGNITMHMGDLWPAGGLPVLESKIGEDIVMTLSASASIGGHLTYYYVGA